MSLMEAPFGIQTGPHVVLAGLCSSAEAYIEALERNNVGVECWARELLEDTPFFGKPQAVKLFVREARQFGFPLGGQLGEVMEAIAREGIDPTPAEIGPALALALAFVEPLVDPLRIAMTPIVQDGRSGAFLISRHKERVWLSGISAAKDWSCPPHRRFVVPAPQ